jgi:hypothetical protein
MKIKSRKRIKSKMKIKSRTQSAGLPGQDRTKIPETGPLIRILFLILLLIFFLIFIFIFILLFCGLVPAPLTS